MTYGLASGGEPGYRAGSGRSDWDPIRTLLAEQVQKLRPGTSAEAAWIAAGVVSSALEEHANADTGFDASAFDTDEIGSSMARELQRIEEMPGGSGMVST
jgi:hypothetical protein